MAQKINLSIIGAANLPNLDGMLGGKSDPCCTVSVGLKTDDPRTIASAKHVYKTKTVDDNIPPKWNETTCIEWDGKSNITVTVRDEDICNTADFLGTVEFTPAQIAKGRSGEQSLVPGKKMEQPTVPSINVKIVPSTGGGGKEFQRIAADNVGTGADAVMLAAAPLEVADDWKASLTPKQQQRLQNEFDDLHWQAEDEQKYAAMEVKHSLEIVGMQKEYARNEVVTAQTGIYATSHKYAAMDVKHRVEVDEMQKDMLARRLSWLKLAFMLLFFFLQRSGGWKQLAEVHLGLAFLDVLQGSCGWKQLAEVENWYGCLCPGWCCSWGWLSFGRTTVFSTTQLWLEAAGRSTLGAGFSGRTVTKLWPKAAG